jgi:hypothetical protein
MLLHLCRDTGVRMRVQSEKDNANMKIIRVAIVASAIAALGVCMAVPVAPGYYADSAGYYAPAPVYYAPPVYLGPSIGVGVYGGRGGYGYGHGHSRGRGRGHR